MMPSSIIMSPPDRHNGNGATASSIPKPPYIVLFSQKNIFIVSFYTFNDGFDLAIFYNSTFIFNSTGLFRHLLCTLSRLKRAK